MSRQLGASNSILGHMSKLIHKELPVVAFETKEAFYDWFSKNYDREQAFWLRYYKMGPLEWGLSNLVYQQKTTNKL